MSYLVLRLLGGVLGLISQLGSLRTASTTLKGIQRAAAESESRKKWGARQRMENVEAVLTCKESFNEMQWSHSARELAVGINSMANAACKY